LITTKEFVEQRKVYSSIHQNHTDHSVNKVNKSVSKVVLSFFPSDCSWNYL